MARYERRSVLESIQNPFTEYARAAEETQANWNRIEKTALTAYEAQRVQQAKEEAGELQYKPGDELEKRTELTATGRAFNEVSTAGYVASVKNQYTARLDQLYLENKNDPAKFKNSSDAYLKGLLNNVPPELRGAVSIDYGALSNKYTIGAQRNAKELEIAEATAQINAASARIADDASKSARSGEYNDMHYQEWQYNQAVIEPLKRQGNVVEAEKKQRAFVETLENQAILGEMDRRLEQGLDSGKQFLEGFKKSDHGLSPQRADAVYSKMEALYNDKKAIDADMNGATRKVWKSGFADYQAYLSAGGEDTLANQEHFSDEKIDQMYDTPQERAIAKESLADARDFGATYNKLKLASAQEAAELINAARPDSLDVPNYAREQKQYETLVAAKAARDNALAKDPASYILGTNPELKDQFTKMQEKFLVGQADPIDVKTYIETQREAQMRMGLRSDQVQIIPQTMEDQIALTLNDMTNGGENSVLMLNSLKGMLGDDWKTVVRQLGANKKIGNSARVISSMTDPQLQRRVAEAMSFSVKEYKEIADPDVVKDIQDYSADQLSDLAETFSEGYGPNGLKTWMVYKEATERMAMKLVADGEESSYDDALDAAKEIIFGDVEVVGSYRVPLVVNGQPNDINSIRTGVGIIQQFIKDKTLAVATPPSAVIENLEDANDAYIKMVIPKAITSKSGDGVVFVDQFGDVMKNTKGENMEFSWKEIHDFTMQHEFDQ
jgi:hypothetical protein